MMKDSNIFKHKRTLFFLFLSLFASLLFSNDKVSAAQLSGAEIIARTAEALAWPKGTPEKYWKNKAKNNIDLGKLKSEKWNLLKKYGDGRPTELFQKAMDEVIPDHWTREKQKYAAAAVGASCDRFVSVVVRYSGYDKNYPTGLRGNNKNPPYKRLPNKFQYVSYSANKLKRGDIVQTRYTKSGGGEGGHTFIYLGNDIIADAGLPKRWGRVRKVSKSYLNISSSKNPKIFRPIGGVDSSKVPSEIGAKQRYKVKKQIINSKTLNLTQ